MLRQRHHHLHAVAPSTTPASPAVPDFGTSSTPAACRTSSQQAAAAWAWFEHGGSSCITPSKAEGLVAARRRANCIFTKPSRFRLEVLISRQIPLKGFAEHAITEDGRRFAAARHRRHSFHDNRTSDMYWRFSSSCRKAPGSPYVNFDVDGIIGDESEAENELEGTGDSLCQEDDEGSSLLDKFEVEAVRRQLHDQLISGRISAACSSPGSSPTCSTELHEDHESRKAQHDHRHHHAHIKPRRSFKSSDAAASHKPVADNEHHHNKNDVVHRLLHLRIKTSPGRLISSALAPAICSSIATANSIVDHHHGQSPKHQKATSPIINQTAKRQQAALHNWGSMQNMVNGVSVAADAEQHERQDYTLKHNYKSHPKEVLRRDCELNGDGVQSTPSNLHHSDSKLSKALLPLVSHLPHLSALALGHHKRGAKSWRDDGALHALQALSNRHSHSTSEHLHIHHHHHHYYHHPEHTSEALKGGRVRHFLQEGDAGDHVLQAPSLYKFLKEELTIPAADHGGGPGRPREYVAVQNVLSRQSASRSKLQKL